MHSGRKCDTVDTTGADIGNVLTVGKPSAVKPLAIASGFSLRMPPFCGWHPTGKSHRHAVKPRRLPILDERDRPPSP